MIHIFKYTSLWKSSMMRCLFLMVWALVSCEDFVDVDPPNNQLTGSLVFKDVETVDAALANIYGQLRDEGLVNGGISGLAYQLGHYTDELTLYSTSQPGIQLFYDNNLLASNSAVLNLWNSSYNLIYDSNKIIEGVQSAASLPEEDKDRVLGEAYFIRAFIHFYLVNLFGDIPYIDTTDYRANSKISRMDIDLVYQKLIDDLKISKALLSANDTDVNRVRPNTWVATSLLARVYLYNQKWDLALSEATEVLSNGDYLLNTDITQVFLKNSTETLWQFDTGASNTNTIDALTYIFTSGPPPNSALADYFISGFEPGDMRLSNWVGVVTNGTDIWYYPFKYKRNQSGITEECSIVFRLAELYLISAEANAQLGHIDDALVFLNAIRERADLTPVSTGDTTEILEAIYQERRMEFFSEMGHRFFDLKRTGQANGQLSIVKPNWKSTDVLLPIPESELLLNPNLNPQNDGY